MTFLEKRHFGDLFCHFDHMGTQFDLNPTFKGPISSKGVNKLPQNEKSPYYTSFVCSF